MKNRYNLCGNILMFNTNLLEYNQLRNIFFKRAEDEWIAFVEYYQNNIKCYEDVFSKALPKINALYEKSMEYGARFLEDYGYELVKEQLIEAVSDDSVMNELYSLLNDISKEMNDFTSSIEYNRKMERASRSHWEGGGFGIRGAISGSIKAGVLNLGTDMIRGIGDIFVDAGDSIKISDKKKKLCENPRFMYTICEYAYYSCLEIFDIVDVLLFDGDIFPEIDFPEKNLFVLQLADRAKTSLSDKEKATRRLCECIQNDPYTIEYYEKLYGLYPNYNEDFICLLQLFNNTHSVLYKNVWKNYADEFESEIKPALLMPADTNDELRKKELAVKKIRSKYTYFSNTIFDDYLDKEKKLLQIKSLRIDVDNYVANGNIDALWSCVNSGNVYAQFVLEKYYCNPEKKRAFLSELEKKVVNDNDFAQYLYIKIKYDIMNTSRNNDDLRMLYAASVINKLSDKGLACATTTIAILGFEKKYNAIIDGKNALYLLDKAVKQGFPKAMEYMGMLYSKGAEGISVNVDKAKELLGYAVAYGLELTDSERRVLNK